MPAKYRPSTYKRVDGKRRATHYYMSQVKTETLLEDLEKEFTPPRKKDKIRKELSKRGIT